MADIVRCWTTALDDQYKLTFTVQAAKNLVELAPIGGPEQDSQTEKLINSCDSCLEYHRNLIHGLHQVEDKLKVDELSNSSIQQ